MTQKASTELAPVEEDGEWAPVRLAEVEARRERLIDLYTTGDIDRATFRARRARLDEQARDAAAEMVGRTRDRMVVAIPSTSDELVAAWKESGIEYQRLLIDTLLHPIVVNPAQSRRRAFDPGRLEVAPRAQGAWPARKSVAAIQLGFLGASPTSPLPAGFQRHYRSLRRGEHLIVLHRRAESPVCFGDLPDLWQEWPDLTAK